MYEWDFQFVWKYLPALLHGMWVTLVLTVLSCLLGTVFGTGLALLRLTRFRPLRWMLAAVVELGLAIPVLVWLIWIKFCGPQISDVLRLDNFTVAVISLTLALTPFVSETLRSAFDTLPRRYSLAASAVGMSAWQSFRRILLPLAFRRTWPVMISHYVTVMKLVSVCSIIAVPELIHNSMLIISREFRPLEAYTTAAFLYVLMVLPLTALSRVLERSYLVRS